MSSSLRVFIVLNKNDSDGLLIDVLPFVSKTKSQDVAIVSNMKAAAR